MEVELISNTQYPLGTLYYVWKQSRHNDKLPTPEVLQALHDYKQHAKDYSYTFQTLVSDATNSLGFKYPLEAADHIRSEVQMILNESIPVTENVQFVFHLRGIPISLREQMVRHRIGLHFGPNVGVDDHPDPEAGLVVMQQIPDLAESSWWSQTSRVIPYNEFYDEGRFIVPDSMDDRDVRDPVTGAHMQACALYDKVMWYIQECYKSFENAGIHIEDCRQVIPQGATSNITWEINLKSLLHIVGKRSCWIAQVGMWGQIMAGMVREISEKVHPVFRQILRPMCASSDMKFDGCPVNGTNVERVQGSDGMPPCPLWIRHQTVSAVKAEASMSTPAWELCGDCIANNPANWCSLDSTQVEQRTTMNDQFSELWGFNVVDGLPGEK